MDDEEPSANTGRVLLLNLHHVWRVIELDQEDGLCHNLAEVEHEVDLHAAPGIDCCLEALEPVLVLMPDNSEYLSGPLLELNIYNVHIYDLEYKDAYNHYKCLHDQANEISCPYLDILLILNVSEGNYLESQ